MKAMRLFRSSPIMSFEVCTSVAMRFSALAAEPSDCISCDFSRSNSAAASTADFPNAVNPPTAAPMASPHGPPAMPANPDIAPPSPPGFGPSLSRALPPASPSPPSLFLTLSKTSLASSSAVILMTISFVAMFASRDNARGQSFYGDERVLGWCIQVRRCGVVLVFAFGASPYQQHGFINSAFVVAGWQIGKIEI